MKWKLTTTTARGLRRAASELGRWLSAVARDPRLRCTLLMGAAAAAFVAGLLLPFVRVSPGQNLGAVEGFVVWLISDDDAYSLLGSIAAIWDDDRLLGGAAFLFSVVFPTVKLLVLTICAARVGGEKGAHPYRSWAERMGPWSMLEVFLLAMTLLITKSMPFGTKISVLPGFLFFFTSILLSLVAAWTLPREPPGRPAPFLTAELQVITPTTR